MHQENKPTFQFLSHSLSKEDKSAGEGIPATSGGLAGSASIVKVGGVTGHGDGEITGVL